MLEGFGVHSSIFASDWISGASHAVDDSVRYGLDFIEIPLLDPANSQPERDRGLLQKSGLKALCSLALPEGCWPSVNGDEAVDFLKLALDKTEQIGAVALSGVIYGGVGQRSGNPPTDREIDDIARALEKVAAYARSKNIALGIEPINRYENHLINTGSQAAGLIEKIGADGMFVHLDTYHMNIEERGIARGIIDCGEHLGYIHLSESDRGVPGKGTVPWNEIYGALAAIGYSGGQGIESFVNLPPQFASALCVWRPVADSAEEVMAAGLPFLKNLSRQYGLTA
ncbi:sugar phosphate isomerase/epimerase family protein [Nitratireductor luteus]|uniref:sugar phosphate isomerase/epimerase family protein n=1 Tax=Nitratireductor luteus TaxID=2976980 RepID=UPI0022401657|nr:sugar phosphate isomerase/epimerase family protein [Nitratireductor luteus]